MKNVHIIPTDKPSRLFLGNNRSLVFGIIKSSIQSHNDDFTNQNIYITNDEEIKEGEYGLSKLNEVIKFNSGYDYRYYSKITLTTDLQLITDGVQDIDDEFLEWFVKNPSCEEVKVEGYIYKGQDETEYKIIIPKEEPNQETLEEGFKRIYNTIDFSEFDFHSFRLGTKWQQERSYSEEEVKKAYCNGSNLDYDIMISTKEGNEILEQWFKQFKKK